MSFWTRRSTPALSVVVVRVVRDLPLAAHAYTELRSAKRSADAAAQLNEIVQLLSELTTHQAMTGLPSISKALGSVGVAGERMCSALAQRSREDLPLARFWQRLELHLVTCAASTAACAA